MRRLATLLIVLLLAGCADEGNPERGVDETGTDGPGAGANATAAPGPAATLPGAQWGRTAATPVYTLGPGRWSVAFDELDGIRQFVLALPDGMDPLGYSIGGEFSILIVPLDLQLGACEESEVNLMNAGTGMLSGTFSDELDDGDYFVVVHGDEASADFTWQVGESDEERDLEPAGESSAWSRKQFEAQPQNGAFERELPAGFHQAQLRGSSGALTQSSSLEHAVAAAGQECAGFSESGDLEPFGATTSSQLQTHAATAVTWSGAFTASTVTGAPAEITGVAVVLSPPI